MASGSDPTFTIENKILKGMEYPEYQSTKSLGQCVIERMEENSDITALIDADSEEKYTYGKVKDLSVRCALWLLKQGITQGDIVTLCSHNHMKSSVPFFATLFTGAIFNPWFHESDLKNMEYFMNFTQPKVIFCTKECVNTVAKAAKNKKVETKIVTFEKVPDFEWFEDVINTQNANDVKNFQCVGIASSKQTGSILFSSGTTGMPKGVEISHKSLKSISSFFETNTYDENVLSLWYSSMYWISGMTCALANVLQPLPALIHRNFDLHGTCKVIEKHKVTWVFLSTSQFHRLYKANIITQYNLKSLRSVITGGAKTSWEALNYFTEALPNAFVFQAYGMTETCGAVTTPHKYNDKKKEALGTVAKNVQIKFLNQDTGECLGSNKVGELYVKSPFIMNGYYKNPQATENTIDEEGWIRSGDLGFYDEEGFIFLVDRIKEILKVLGHHVRPLEIEKCLLQHPEVTEVAVIGIPHITDNDHPLAFVSKKSGSKVTEEDLINLAATLGDLQRLRAGVKFLDKFPLTPSGKIDRKRLREMAKEMFS